MIIRASIPFEFEEWRYGLSIEKMKADIAELERLGATHVDIDSSVSYDCAILEISAYCEREETLEEIAQREEYLRQRQEAQRQDEIRTLEKLKAKYPNL